MRHKLQSAIRALYPSQCLCCRDETTVKFALCGHCWKYAAFITGLACDACGIPLDGGNAIEIALCDSCLIAPKYWEKGSTMFLYQGSARGIILALKHGDRHGLVKPLAT